MTLVLIHSVSLHAATPKTDFNGDGKSDLLIGNIFSGQILSWLSNGTTILSRPSYGTVSPSTGWGVIDMRDANADGRTDIYWYNINSGSVATQLVYGTTISQMVGLGSKLRSQGWIPLGLGDYNGDRKFDTFWFNLYSGSVEVWVVNGNSVIQKLALGTLQPSNGWTPIGIRDLNADGRSDILIYNS